MSVETTEVKPRKVTPHKESNPIIKYKENTEYTISSTISLINKDNFAMLNMLNTHSITAFIMINQEFLINYHSITVFIMINQEFLFNYHYILILCLIQ